MTRAAPGDYKDSVGVVVVWLMTMTIKVVDDDGHSGDLKDKSEYEDEINLRLFRVSSLNTPLKSSIVLSYQKS